MQKTKDFLLNKKLRKVSDTYKLKQVLLNALKMKAMYSEGRIKFIETSSAVN